MERSGLQTFSRIQQCTRTSICWFIYGALFTNINTNQEEITMGHYGKGSCGERVAGKGKGKMRKGYGK